MTNDERIAYIKFLMGDLNEAILQVEKYKEHTYCAGYLDNKRKCRYLTKFLAEQVSSLEES